ncbi:uncharacterized protein LOC124120952 [Haliotis rufescens]|uniref:uncharacterized protein LOC124120952 n=1 Tax=Haliotis rufescens TaxID=6454 RepID=UPI001EB022A8|nr:uncharacterized protein LOC124120952 [Haliotis rufescens]
MASKILELDTVLGQYAWRKLEKSINFVKRLFIDPGDYYAVIDWKSLNIEHNIMKFSLRPTNNCVETAWGEITTGSRWVSLYGCEYENKSETKQVHSFRGKRETTTWIAVELQNCYTIDRNVNIDVNLPTNFVKFRAGRDNTMNVSKMKGEVFKEVIPWEVNSQIEIGPSWKASAELLAREECQVIDFEIRTKLSVPKGKLPVYFKKKSDDKVAYLVLLDDFHNAFLSLESGGILDEEEMSLVQVLMETTLDMDRKERSTTSIQLTTQGACTSVAWSDQKVNIKTEPMPNVNNNHVSGLYIERNGLKD